MAHPAINPDYRESLQAAALAYLQRHQGEHLGSDQLLFSRAVNHLTHSLDAAQALAENAVGAAYGELRSAGERLYLDVSTSSGHTAVITDPDSGLTYAVPVAAIVARLLRHPKRRHLHPVH
jgi:hypothetical protein